MNMHLSTTRIFIIIGVILGYVASHGTEQPQDRSIEESVLLEKLKEYVKVYTHPIQSAKDTGRNEAPEDTMDTVWRLTDIGRTNTVQFFLDNINWMHSLGALFDAATVGGRGSRPWLALFGEALLKMENVPLRQCMDALINSEDGTREAQSLEYVTRLIHGKEFLKEVERLAETSPNPERWEAMKKRLQNDIQLRPLQGSPFGDGYIEQGGLGQDDGVLTATDMEGFGLRTLTKEEYYHLRTNVAQLYSLSEPSGTGVASASGDEPRSSENNFPPPNAPPPITANKARHYIAIAVVIIGLGAWFAKRKLT